MQLLLSYLRVIGTLHVTKHTLIAIIKYKMYYLV